MGGIQQGWRYSTAFLREVFLEAFQDLEIRDFNRPDGIVRLAVCSVSGLRPSDACRDANSVRSDYFIEKHAPRIICDYHSEADLEEEDEDEDNGDEGEDWVNGDNGDDENGEDDTGDNGEDPDHENDQADEEESQNGSDEEEDDDDDDEEEVVEDDDQDDGSDEEDDNRGSRWYDR